jgi:hypothetical protein
MIQCANCFVRVIPMVDGICPACGESTTAVGESRWQSLTVRSGTRFPEICCVCDLPSKRIYKITLERLKSRQQRIAEEANDDLDALGLVSRFLGPLGCLFQGLTLFAELIVNLLISLMRKLSKSNAGVFVQIPLCKGCEDKLQIVDVNEDFARIRVTREFARRTKQLE